MFATKLFALAGAAAVAAAIPGSAQAAQQGSHVKVNLTQAPQPDSKPWEDPARISATIDPHGPDTFSAQLNLELAMPLDLDENRPSALKGYVVWDRETGSDDPQNNFELGAAFSSELSTASLDRHGNDEGAGSLRFDA